MAAGKAERLIISGAANENDRRMPGSRGAEQAFRHEPPAKPARAVSLGNGERPKKERWHVPGENVPHPQGANEILPILRCEREIPRGQPSGAQALHGLGETRRPKGFIEQALPCPGIGGQFAGNSETWIAYGVRISLSLRFKS
jgi:hypothetical protein